VQIHCLLYFRNFFNFLEPIVEFKVFMPKNSWSSSVYFPSDWFVLFVSSLYRFNKLQSHWVFNIRFIGLLVRGNVSPSSELSRWHSYAHVSFPFLSLFFRHFALYGQAAGPLNSWIEVVPELFFPSFWLSVASAFSVS